MKKKERKSENKINNESYVIHTRKFPQQMLMCFFFKYNYLKQLFNI